jgi:hypothetical protein
MHSQSSSAPLIALSFCAPAASTSTATLRLCALSCDALSVYDVYPVNNGLIQVFSLTISQRDDLATAMSWNGELIAVGFTSGTIAVVGWQEQQMNKFTATPSPSGIRYLSFGPAPVATSSSLGSNYLGAPPTVEAQNLSPTFLSSPSPDAVNPLRPGHMAASDSSATRHRPPEDRKAVPNFMNHHGWHMNPSSMDRASLEAVIRSTVQNDVSQLRNEMRDALAAVQVETMRQFRLQVEDFNRLLSQQSVALSQVILENQLLRDEVARMRRGEKVQDGRPDGLKPTENLLEALL